MHRTPSTFALVAAVLAALPVCEAKEVGRLAVAQNRVMSLKPGAAEAVLATAGQVVVLNETETTEKGSRAKFLFGEGAVVTIGQNTTFSVSQEVVDQATGASTSKLQVEEGKVRVFVSRFWTGRPAVEVGTPTAVVGIKGSEVMVEVANGKTTVTVFGGEADVRSRSGAGGAARVTAGQQSAVGTSGAASTPVAVAPAALSSLWSSTEPVPDPPMNLPANLPTQGTSGSSGSMRTSSAAEAAATACLSCSGTTSSFGNPAVEASRDTPGPAGQIVNSGNKAGAR